MGYTTEFEGKLTFNKPLQPWLRDYINDFARIRHMKRDVDKIKEIDPNWAEHCYNGDLGKEGRFYIPPKEIPSEAVDIDKSFCAGLAKTYLSLPNVDGQVFDKSIVDYNHQAEDLPGLWCQWVINENGDLEWDGGEKFYHYVEWLQYLIDTFFIPNGYILNGELRYVGDPDDTGIIRVVENNVFKIPDQIEKTDKATKAVNAALQNAYTQHCKTVACTALEHSTRFSNTDACHMCPFKCALDGDPAYRIKRGKIIKVERDQLPSCFDLYKRCMLGEKEAIEKVNTYLAGLSEAYSHK